MAQSIQDYRTLPPMTADVLISIVNDILKDKSAVLVSKRTLRFYIAREVVPSPMGSPKFARYGYEHLLSVITARALQDHGMKIEQVARETSEITRGRFDRLEGMVNAWLEQQSPLSTRLASVRETGKELADDTVLNQLAQLGKSSIRVNLTNKVTLEITDPTDIKKELHQSRKALDKLISELKD